MKVSELKEQLEDVDDNLDVVISSGGALYQTEDVDYNTLTFEIKSGQHYTI